MSMNGGVLGTQKLAEGGLSNVYISIFQKS